LQRRQCAPHLFREHPDHRLQSSESNLTLKFSQLNSGLMNVQVVQADFVICGCFMFKRGL
jgi:hypothetical protein